MPDATALVTIVAGVAGLVLTQVGTLVPTRKDFIAQAKLKREACLEHLASSHFYLARESQSVGIEDFDNMRGDGRTSRDYFAEYASKIVTTTNNYWRLLWAERWFRVSHALLLLSIALLILLGAGKAISTITVPYAGNVAIFLLALEITSLISIYVLNAKTEGMP